MQSGGSELADVFDLAEAPEVEAAFNIAPTDPVVVVRANAEARRFAEPMRWGLVPQWAADLKVGARMINARSETIDTKGAFKHAFRRRRCLIAADGWYEWETMPDGKQPFRFVSPDRKPFGIAGIWEEWLSPEGVRTRSTSIITTDANAACAKIHNRMPVVLDPAQFATWLDPMNRDATALKALLVPAPVTRFEHYPVSRQVNSVRNEGAHLIDLEPLQAALF